MYRAALGQDHLWLRKDEAEALVKGVLPASVKVRLARYHLIDNTRGEPPLWRADEIKQLQLSLKDGKLTGSVHLQTRSGDRGYQARLLGFLDVKDGKVVGPKDKSDMPIGGISWGSPMMPTGKDGFGVYWFVKASEFRNGKVNYIIHKGDSKDQCAKDMFWFIETQGREAFINSGDCNIYFKVEDALAARKK